MRNKHYFLAIFIFSILVSCTKKSEIAKELNSEIRINQLGYFPNSTKNFMVADSAAGKFEVTDSSGCVVLSGKLKDKGYWDKSGENIKVGDFSSLNKKGIYTIRVEGMGSSFPFEISENVYSEVAKASVKALYLHRMSIPIEEKYAGIYKRPAGHPDTLCLYHPTTGYTEGGISSPGGWYDAGDYNKYMINAGITLGLLMDIHQLYPDFLPDNSLNIPESGNGINDLLDEIKFELDWVLTMQDKDGGVFAKLTTKRFDKMVMPHEAKMQRFVLGKSTLSSLHFAAITAQASRVFKNSRPEFSETCYSAAIKAWEWAVANDSIGYRNPPDIITGEYGGDNFDDEFFWAATEMYLITRDEQFLETIKKYAIPFDMKVSESWRLYISNLGYYTIALNNDDFPKEFYNEFTEQIVPTADELMKKMEAIPYRIPLDEFVWGSTSDVLDMAIVFAFAHQLTHDNKYLNAVVELSDYIYGKNATNYSFVTGFGDQPPMFPHHRPSAADQIDAPYPGWLVGGPNHDRQDLKSDKKPWGVVYASTYPAKAFVDHTGSYASNEVCLNWQASLIFINGYLHCNKDNL